MKNTENKVISEWLEKYGDPNIQEKVLQKLLKERLEYLKSDESKGNVLGQISEFLSHKYNCTISVNTYRSAFNIEGLNEEKEAELMNDLKSIGIVW